MANDDRPPFFARWSRRKEQARSGEVPAEPVAPVPARVAVPPDPLPRAVSEANPPSAPAVQVPEGEQPVPLPTMNDVAELTHSSDYSRFVARGVEPGVRNAAMKKLFSDPHFNVMDRLDIYIDDYSQPDPIPESMLRQMVQSKFLGLFDHEQDEEKDGSPPAPAPAAGAVDSPALAAADNPAIHDHTDLQLQPDDAAGRPGPDQGVGSGKV